MEAVRAVTMMYPRVIMLIILTILRLLPIEYCKSCDNDVSNGDNVDYYENMEVVTNWKMLEL